MTGPGDHGNRDRQLPDKTITTASGDACAHHWVLGTPPQATGRCKHCGATREFALSAVDVGAKLRKYGDRGGASRRRGAQGRAEQ